MSAHTPPLRLDAYTRRLGPVADPAALVAAFAPSARGGSSALLATEDGASIVILSALARVTGRGRSISVEVLEPTARPLLDPLAAALAPRGMVRRAGAALTFEPATPDPWLDEEARLLAPGPLDALRALVLGSSVLACDEPAQRLAVGLLGYDLVDAYEGLPAPRVASAHPTLDLLLPELLLSVAPGGRDATLTALVPRDADREVHARALGRLVAAERLAGLPAAPPAPAAPVEARADLDDDAYAALVERMQAHVRAGDVFQIVPARAFRAPCPDPLAAFRRLAALNPSRYAFCLTAPERTLFGCSPETAVAVDGRTRTARLTPIAGTRPRARGADGALDAELDARLLAELHLDPKELAEHVMLVDLARNDLARVSEPGTRRVVELFRAVKSSHVMHLVSEVEGRLRDGLDALHAYAACLNMGTLTGAPKLRAMELLREHEPEARGFYGGGFGALRGDGSLDTAIVIRSAEVARGVATVRAGAGVVLDSIPAREAEETRRKAQAVLAALGAKEAS